MDFDPTADLWARLLWGQALDALDAASQCPNGICACQLRADVAATAYNSHLRTQLAITAA